MNDAKKAQQGFRELPKSLESFIENRTEGKYMSAAFVWEDNDRRYVGCVYGFPDGSLIYVDNGPWEDEEAWGDDQIWDSFEDFERTRGELHLEIHEFYKKHRK